MRLLRVLAVGSACAALVSQPLTAQEGRQFKDAWFWGAKGGVLLYSSASSNQGLAPTIGADWLITRSRGGIYVAYDQAFLRTTGSFTDRDPAYTPFDHFVRLTDVRRVSVAGMVFPMQSPTLHPYFGAGFLFNQIGATSLQSGASPSFSSTLVSDSVRTKRTAFTPLFMGGVQARLPGFSAFGQVSASPTERSFFLSRAGAPFFSVALAGGVRYNVGSSVDRMR